MKLLPIIAVAAAAVSLSAADWTGYRDATEDYELVWSCGFETGDHPPYTESGYRIEPKAGINGGGGLVVSRSDPEEYRFQGLPMPPLEAGRLYRLSLWVRGRDLPQAQPAQSLEFAGMEFDLDGVYHSGSYFFEPVGRDEFTFHSKEFTMPPGAQASLTLYLQRRQTGEMIFDNVALESVGENYPAILTWPAELAIRPGDRRFRFKVDPGAPSGLDALVEAGQGGVTREVWRPVGEDGVVAGEWPGEWGPGPLEVTVTLADRTNKVICGRSSYLLNVWEEAEAPANACLIDEYGRAVVDGELFMPVGIYAVHGDADLDRVAAAGFNCVLNYETLWNWGKGNSPEQAAEFLDKVQARGMKAILTLQSQLPGSNPDWMVSSWGEAVGVDAATAKIVRAFKDHPALLAWYVSDEAVRKNVPQVQALRQLVSAGDPWHPTWTLTCHYNDLPYYGVSGDIVGVDAYPIRHEAGDDQHIGEVAQAMAAASSTGLPVWMVPQIFNWGRQKEPVWDAETWRRSRAPNADEIMAMPLLAAIQGAKGFVFFAYLDVIHGNEAAMPGSSEAEWAKVVPMAQVMRELAPFLLSLEQAPEVTVEGDAAETVRARAFAIPGGDLRVLVVACGDPVEAVIRIGGGRELRSQTGRSRPLGDGGYLFAAESVSWDILQ